jgi:hypothetical protein
MTEVTSDNYQKYLTFHGQTIDGAWYVINKWTDTKEYHVNETIHLWVDASRKFLEIAKV